MKKRISKSDRALMGRVVALGCIVCRNKRLGHTPAECHHIRTGYGTSQRAPHDETLPLCPVHHRTGDGTGKYRGEIGYHFNSIVFQVRYGTEHQLLEQVRGLLHEQ